MHSFSAVAAMAILTFTSSVITSPVPDTLTINNADCTSTTDRCAGDITYYDGGLGACGINYDTHTQNVVSLAHAFMGTLSNSNPFCGRHVTLFNPATGVTAEGIVGDKCMGCVDRSVDLTDVLFSKLTNGNMGLGRVHNVQWWFTS